LALLLGFAALAAKLGACRQLRAAAGTFSGRQRGAALLAKARFVHIGAAALGTRITGIATAWAGTLRRALITPVVTTFRTDVMTTALIATVVASKFATHQVTQHSFEESHGLLLCS
jgi:hypothetical protein